MKYINIKYFYRFLFWSGYVAVLVTAFLPVKSDLTKINIGTYALHIRLDHLLHLIVYFLICMYFLLGVCKGITLFKKNSLLKFIQLVLLLATVTEVVQLWVPERAFNPMDWISNVAGICVGIIVIIFYGKAEGPD